MDQDNKHIIIGMLITFVFMMAFIGGMWIFIPQEESFPTEEIVNNTITKTEE